MIEFKTQRIADEWMDKRLYPRLKKIILMIASYVEVKYDKNIVLTDIYRAQEEQEVIYGKGTRKKSVHQFWRGIDVRTYNLTMSEIADVIQLTNNIPYDKNRPHIKTAICHTVRGSHMHIQVRS